MDICKITCFDFKWKISDKLPLYKFCEIHLVGAFDTLPSVLKMQTQVQRSMKEINTDVSAVLW